MVAVLLMMTELAELPSMTEYLTKICMLFGFLWVSGCIYVILECLSGYL